MNAKTRREQILDILDKEGYVSVKYLTDALGYSTATVNRDLNILAGQHLVTRSYGGVESIRSRYVPVFFRTHKMRAEKRIIGKTAASFVRDGDTLFIDGSTTAQCMEQYLIPRRDLTVITNNMALAINISGHGHRAICLGGEVAEAPCMLFGAETTANAARYRVDKMFFATGAVSSDGMISSGLYDSVFSEIAKRAGEIFYLVDHKKIDLPFHTVFCDFDRVDTVISDYEFPPATKQRFPNTRFILTGK